MNKHLIINKQQFIYFYKIILIKKNENKKRWKWIRICSCYTPFKCFLLYMKYLSYENNGGENSHHLIRHLLDIFAWKYMKSQVYKKKINNIQGLKNNITSVVFYYKWYIREEVFNCFELFLEMYYI